MSEYAFCEPVWASTSSREHIRVVTDGVLHLGGGIDVPALCGFDLARGWDVPTGVTERRVVRGLSAECNPTCPNCAHEWAVSTGSEWVAALTATRPDPTTNDLPETSED